MAGTHTRRSKEQPIYNLIYHVAIKGLFAGLLTGSVHLFIINYLSKVHDAKELLHN